MASLIDLFKGSPYDTVKSDEITFFEQETNGLRKDLLFDPLIYGTDIVRITTHTTRTLDVMKNATQGELATGGLIGKGLTLLSKGKINSIPDLRNTIENTLGLPVPLIPTRVAIRLQNGQNINQVLEGKNGTFIGNILKDSGGGSFENIAKNTLGIVVDKLKKEAKKILIGNPGTIGIANGNPNGPIFIGKTDIVTYEEVQQELDYRGDVDDIDSFNENIATKFKVDLANYSPIYGVRRGSKLYDNDLGHRIREDVFTNNNLNQGLSPYQPSDPYTGKPGNPDTVVEKKSLELRYGLTNESDRINSTSITDEYISSDLEKSDLVPFWISLVGEEKRVHFRTLLTGMSETVTPSWSEGNFFGNPYSFRTYNGVSRNVTFSLFIYCMNPIELGNNWEKMTRLTQFAYPTGTTESGLITPPLIEFRLGDIYNKKRGYVDSLSYTFPDNGTWETDLEGFALPKFIEVSIGITFIEQLGTEISDIYNYKKSKEATKEMNDHLQTTNFSTDPTFQSNGQRMTDTANSKVKVNSLGLKSDIKSTNISVKDIRTGKKQTTPANDATTPVSTLKSGISEISEKELSDIYNTTTKQSKLELKSLGKIFSK